MFIKLILTFTELFFKNLHFQSTVIEFNKLSFNVRNAKGLNIFKNKACLIVITIIKKMVGAGASTTAGSSIGVAYV